MIKLIAVDGSRFYASGVMRPIRNGELTGYVKVMRDMTQQQLFTEELHRLVAERTIELQRSNEDLRQFAHVASHDLKEPVRKVKTFNSRIIDEYADALPAKVRTYLDKIESATDRMYSMIEGVLKYSNIEYIDSAFTSVDITEIIRNIESDLEVLIAKKNAVISITDLPTITAVPVLIYQLFYNLILNSLKFAKAGESSRINISCTFIKEDEKNFVKIILSDNGIGFEQEFEQTIFETFTRLNPADKYEGTGLGLALCKKITERHHGSISATGKLNEGTVFSILLPR